MMTQARLSGAVAVLATAAMVAHASGQAARSTGVQLRPSSSVLPAQTPERSEQASVARLWNEELLGAIRRDNPRPPVVTRYLFHVSAAMYDAWAAYDSTATGVFRTERVASEDVDAARDEAVSYAGYRLLVDRFANSPGAAITLPAFDALMATLGYDPAVTTLDGNSPAAVGNRIAASIIAQSINDGANQENDYADTTGYAPFNGVFVVENPGTGGMNDINRWQPLLVPGAANPQTFLAPHWSEVRPFAIERPALDALYIDPGPPPLLDGDGDAQIRADLMQVLAYSAELDPTDGVVINVSPSIVGNNTFGTQDGTGHPINPATGAPYDDVLVNRGDWGRVLAEFWADGPLSSTPPGHWNEIANEVTEHPALERRYRGAGPELPLLEWDVKKYLAMNGGLHDAAIATWEVKAFYDYGRPISMIRELASRGTAPNGLAITPGIVEEITAESSAPGERHEHLAAYIGEIALYSWRGHPADPQADFGGVGWIRGIEWLPYQQQNFVTPPFAGYTSGHSGFSRAAAESLTLLTGDEYFPGGVGSFLASTGTEGFDLGFEFGPNQDTLLEWATYYDAADEAGISRIYGGIHPAIDDFPGRFIGRVAGIAAFERAEDHFFGTVSSRCRADLAFPYGEFTVDDVMAFIDAFQAQSPLADISGGGIVNVNDVILFVNSFNTGCP